MNARPAIPAEVAREIRKRQGFGCQRCGCPILEYHHIKEWSEEEHFDPDWMMALCPTCHYEVGKWDTDSQLALKNEAAKNICEGLPNGLLQAHSNALDFVVGPARFIGVPTILEVSNEEIIGFKIGEDKRVSPNLKFYDMFGNKVLDIELGAIKLRTDYAWDFLFRGNYLKMWSAPRQVELEIDFRRTPGIIRAKLHTRIGRLIFNENQITLPNNGKIMGGTFERVMVGIGLS